MCDTARRLIACLLAVLSIFVSVEFWTDAEAIAIENYGAEDPSILTVEEVFAPDNGNAIEVNGTHDSTLYHAASVVASGTWGTCPWEITDDGTLTIHGGIAPTTMSSPWNAWKDSITKVKTECDEGKAVVAPSSCSYLFSNFSILTSADLSNWDTSNLTNTVGLFSSCTSLEHLDLSGWDMSAVKTNLNMFSNCKSLRVLTLKKWKTANVFPSFSECSNLQSIDLSNWDTSATTSMSSLFSGCANLRSANLSGWDTSNVVNMSSMFKGCKSLSAINLADLKTTNAKSLNSMFAGCTSLEFLNLNDWDISELTTLDT